MTYIPVSDDANLNDRISMLIKKKRKKKERKRGYQLKEKNLNEWKT